MTDIDFMREICHIDDLLAQMTEEEKLGLVLLFIKDVKKAKAGEVDENPTQTNAKGDALDVR